MNLPWAPLQRSVAEIKDRLSVLPSIREAFVSSIDPLAVRFDTDSSPTKVYATLSHLLEVGDRVLTIKLRHYVWVLGTKRNTDTGPPVGTITAFAGTAAPKDWMLAQGQVLLQTSHPELFNVIGTTYGSNGSNRFNLPDLRGVVVAGLSSADVEFNALGKSFGTKTHTLTQAQMPMHTHSSGNNAGHYVYGGSGQGAGFQGTGFRTQLSTITTGSAGSGQAHNNIQPTLTLNYIIKVKQEISCLSQKIKQQF